MITSITEKKALSVLLFSIIIQSFYLLNFYLKLLNKNNNKNSKQLLYAYLDFVYLSFREKDLT